jgi:hypothetical protein
MGGSLLHWFQVYTGTTNQSGPYYGFWSGFGSDLGELAVLGAVFGAWHRVNCHAKGCWRIGRQHVSGTTYVTCRKHHPDGKPSPERIAEQHRDYRQRMHLYLGEKPGDG